MSVNQIERIQNVWEVSERCAMLMARSLYILYMPLCSRLPFVFSLHVSDDRKGKSKKPKYEEEEEFNEDSMDVPDAGNYTYIIHYLLARQLSTSIFHSKAVWTGFNRCNLVLDKTSLLYMYILTRWGGGNTQQCRKTSGWDGQGGRIWSQGLPRHPGTQKGFWIAAPLCGNTLIHVSCL